MLAFGETIAGLAGKSDIYAADVFHRFVQWVAKVEEDAEHERQSFVGHCKHRLTENIDALVAQLRSTMSKTKDELDFSYQSLDAVSAYVEGIGIERAVWAISAELARASSWKNEPRRTMAIQSG